MARVCGKTSAHCHSKQSKRRCGVTEFCLHTHVWLRFFAVVVVGVVVEVVVIEAVAHQICALSQNDKKLDADNADKNSLAFCQNR
ncbi:unnamed protein product [Polarella glacialis]|uniref:Uncharacterized protein n=1 Tax=Polarella glacialis TaxID=89957 RepID=A0A813JBZ6_POLGL|nr:unnamed protein product [Polarella glacialis]